MKRLVRNQRTLQYFGKHDQWTQDPSLFAYFENIQDVISLQHARKLTHVELVLQMGDEPCKEYDIALPLGDIQR